MSKYTVTRFKPYPFNPGEKIYIEEGPRKGDWEVVEVTDRKVTLRCPVSKKEFSWDRFCYFTESKESDVWPSKE